MDFSVAIRTYNRAEQLRLVLDALISQVSTESIAWEIILVDNNSTDHTAELVQQYQAKWPEHISFNYFLETQQGAAIARRRAIRECQGELIGFLDDDNIPSENWVAAAYQFAQAHPKAAAFGGKSLPIFESAPPEGFKQLYPYFALIDRGEQAHLYKLSTGMLPPGAGLVVHRQTWLDNVPQEFNLNGPTKNGTPTKGEDLEALSHIAQAGHEIWYTPDMVLRHHILADRIQPDYLKNFCYTIGRSSHTLRMLRFKPWQRPLIVLAYFFNDLLKLIKHRIKQSAAPNLITQCQTAMLYGHLQSPFLSLTHQLKYGRM